LHDPLPEQAGQLVQQGAESESLIQLAIACHGRMLELEATDRAAAIRHALAGASLFEALRQRPEAHPSWLPIHEEQCCRYGGIWIHDWISQGNDHEPHWPHTGLRLLERMQQLHSEPLGWAGFIAAELRRRMALHTQTDATPPLLLVMVGNCQSGPLLLGLQQALPEATIHFCPPVYLADAADVRQLHAQLGQADRLIAQRVQPGYRDGIGLDTATLRALLPTGAETLVLPNLHYEGHHPWLGYAHDPDGLLAALEADSPLGGYQDFLAMAAAARGLSLASLLEHPAPEPLLELLRQQHQASLAELRRREQYCTLTISDWIAERHRQQPIAHTINHPTQASLDQLLRRLLSALGIPNQLGEALFDPNEYLGALSLPIHPWVRQALALEPWAERWGQRGGTPLLIEAQLAAGLAFYRQHPWIAAANAHHPKWQLANTCLDLLMQPPPLVDLLHLHGFKCAGSTFIGSLEHATEGQVAYVESPQINQRLPWQRARQHLGTLAAQPQAITSHLITLPPPGELARLKVAFLRDPLARLASAYRYQLHVMQNLEPIPFTAYLERVCRCPLANYQTRHLSPQDPNDWEQRQGWAARPEAIDLQRPDLFVGLVERYDDSILALEYELEQLGCPLDLAYPQRLNTTTAHEAGSDGPTTAPTERILQATELDASLYRRAAERLDERLAAVPELAARRESFQERCQRLRQQPSPHTIKPTTTWTLLSAEGVMAPPAVNAPLP